MPTRLLTLVVAGCFVALLVIVGNSAAATHVTPTPAATAVAALTEEVTAEATANATPEATAPAPVGDPVRGEDIFRHGLNGAPPCVTCHNPLVAGKGTTFAIGPGLKGIGERGATRIEGFTALEYIQDSIRHPANFIVPGYNPIMPTVFGEQYSDQDIVDLVAFLLTI